MIWNRFRIVLGSLAAAIRQRPIRLGFAIRQRHIAVRKLLKSNSLASIDKRGFPHSRGEVCIIKVCISSRDHNMLIGNIEYIAGGLPAIS